MRRTNKDILLGLVGTLTDRQCKEVYYLIKDMEQQPIDWIDFGGGVKLTCTQYSKLIAMWGKDKTDKCVDIFRDWLKDKTITHRISHYYNIIGWVEDKYNDLYPSSREKDISTYGVDTEWKAREYVKSIPKELLPFDTEVKFLVERYGASILDFST